MPLVFFVLVAGVIVVGDLVLATLPIEVPLDTVMGLTVAVVIVIASPMVDVVVFPPTPSAGVVVGSTPANSDAVWDSA